MTQTIQVAKVVIVFILSVTVMNGYLSVSWLTLSLSPNLSRLIEKDPEAQVEGCW